ncbi:MAG: T9SS C-terminal target domain-containing protein [Bacteroidetes bacterium]|nr:MAG: T9SS C-terminal target domain-containing protein [Bacteroidota bacterium]
MKNLIKILINCWAIIMLSSSLAFTQSMTFTVNTRNDAPDLAIGDGICSDLNGNCTLRAAIQEANANIGFHDVIQFNIPSLGVQTILPVTPLPTLTDNAGVTIDGFSQPGAMAGINPPATATLMVELKGNTTGFIIPAHGIWILSDNNDISGLIINEFTGDGIRIEGTPMSTDNNFIHGNFIGTDATGTVDAGNATASSTNAWWAGVNLIVPPCDGNPVFVANNFVHHNLISGNGAVPVSVNRGEGVSITSCPPGDNSFNVIEFNYIGTDKTGNFPIGNDSDGVTIAEAAHDNIIGDNVISGNGFSGVGINGLVEPPRYTRQNHVVHNTIGLDVTQTFPIPNGFQGVSIGMYGPVTWGFAPNNFVIDNTISGNLQNGVLVAEFYPPALNCDENLISQNRIFNNGMLGIDLVSFMGFVGVVTFNDPAPDADFGPNQEVNFPVINSAIINGGTTTITGTVDFPSPHFGFVEVFEVHPDWSGHGEGMNWVGTAVPDAAGNWSLNTPFPLSVTSQLTATSTDQSQNTSEFAANFSNIVNDVTDPKQANFHVFPNPTSGVISIVAGEEIQELFELQVLNAPGTILQHYDISGWVPGEAFEIAMHDLASGVYWLRLTNGKSAVVKKILLVK